MCALVTGVQTCALPIFVILNFLLLQMLPGDAVDVIAAESGSATQETMAQLRAHFGLDVSMPQQLWNYLSNLLHFDLGNSPRPNIPETTLIGTRKIGRPPGRARVGPIVEHPVVTG